MIDLCPHTRYILQVYSPGHHDWLTLSAPMYEDTAAFTLGLKEAKHPHCRLRLKEI